MIRPSERGGRPGGPSRWRPRPPTTWRRISGSREEWRDNKAVCAYCQTATLVSLASAVLALPEAVRGVLQMLRG